MSGRDRIEELVAEALEASETEGPQAFERICDRHPSRAGELRRRVGVLRGYGLAGGAEPTHPARLGEFELLEPIGGGGMGIVYRAWQASQERHVALKVVRPERLYFPGARERFRREVEAVARLAHPGIVPIHAIGEENGVPFFVMELCQGVTLAEIVERLRGRSPEDLDASELGQTGDWAVACVRIARQVADALHHAHARGVIHRDVKPSNIQLAPNGRALLFDFGLARTDAATRLTVSGTQPGSLPYMSPEQLQGAHAGAPSDVYSLGVTLYELLTLRSPFLTASAESTRCRILDSDPSPIRMLNRSVPADVETVCLCAMDRDPQRRYPTAAAFADDLGRVLDRRPVAARRPGALLKARRWMQRHPTASLALALGGLLAVGVPSVLWLQQRAHGKRVERALGIAEGRRLTAISASLLRTDPGLALLTAIEGAQRHRDLEADNALVRAIAACDERRTFVLGARVVCTAFSPDGRHAVAGGKAGARVFDAVTGASVASLVAGKTVQDVAFQPGGARLATGCRDGSLQLWQTATWSRMRDFTLPAAIRCVAFSPDGRLLAATAEDGSAAVFDVAAARRMRDLRGHTACVYHAAFDPASRRVVTASEDRSARIWSLETGGPPVVLELPGSASAYWGAIWHAEFDAGGKRVLTPVCDGTLRVWDAASGALLTTMSGHVMAPLHAGYSPDGRRILSTSTGGTACIWDAATGKLLHRLRGHRARLWTGAWNPDGSSVATVSWDGTARVWDAASGVLIAVLRGHGGRVWDVSFHPGGTRLLTAGDDGTARLWQMPDRDEIAAHEGPITKIVLGPAGRLAATTSADGLCKVWRADLWTPVATLKGHTGSVLHAAFDDAGAGIVTVATDRTARLWDVRTGAARHVLAGHEVPPGWCAFARRGASVVTVCSGVVRAWDAATGRCLWRYEAPKSGLRDCRLSPGGETFTAVVTQARRMLHIELATGETRFDTRTPHVSHWMPGPGVELRVGSGTARLQWAGREQSLILASGHGLGPSAFCRDERLLAVGHQRGSVRLFDLDAGGFRDLGGHAGPIQYVGFDPSGRWLVTLSAAGPARIWRTDSGRQVLSADAPEGVRSVAFTPGGSGIVTGSGGGVLRVLHLDPDPLRTALARKPRELTGDELRRLGIERPTNGSDTSRRRLDRRPR